ncbi:hypothetical protein F5X96DRAFT_110874 [Biscogniauxia mediterranea]|nr:hypothetical protein F5X96DRAFT_110874 [Biscogniauxia mediterranea]
MRFQCGGRSSFIGGSSHSCRSFYRATSSTTTAATTSTAKATTLSTASTTTAEFPDPVSASIIITPSSTSTATTTTTTTTITKPTTTKTSTPTTVLYFPRRTYSTCLRRNILRLPRSRFSFSNAPAYRYPLFSQAKSTLATMSKPQWTGVGVRKTFLDYFEQRGHTIGTPSPSPSPASPHHPALI